MLSGLWLLAIMLVAHGTGHTTDVPDLFAWGGVALLWGGHLVSPVIASWTNRDLRGHMMQRPGTFIIFPAVLLVVGIAFGVLGDLSQWPGIPADIAAHVNPRLALFYVFIVWDNSHFAGQHFGVLAIYRRTAGQASKRDRSLDRAFAVVMTSVLLPLAWYSQVRAERFGPLFSYLPNPGAFPDLASTIVIVGAVLTVLYVTFEAMKPNASLPRALYIISIGIQPMFGTFAYPIYHLAIYTICHWLIAYALASRILGSQSASADRPLRVSARGLFEPRIAMWLVVFTLTSVVMYMLFHSRTIHGLLGVGPRSGYGQQSLFAYKTGVVDLGFGILTGAYFGLSFIHYAYDRLFYAFSKPEIRQWVAPHLFWRTTGGRETSAGATVSRATRLTSASG